MVFANPEDWILAEEWTYPLALAGAHPRGIKFAPVAADGEGLCAVDLRRVLAEWNEVERGGKRSVFRLIPWNHITTVKYQAPRPLHHPCRAESHR